MGNDAGKMIISPFENLIRGGPKQIGFIAPPPGPQPQPGQPVKRESALDNDLIGADPRTWSPTKNEPPQGSQMDTQTIALIAGAIILLIILLKR